MTKQYPLLVLTIASSACLDVDLLDDMLVLDSGPGVEESAEGSSNADGVGQSTERASPTPDPTDSAPPGVLPMNCAMAERNLNDLCVLEGVTSASVRLVTNEPARIMAGAPDPLTLGVLSSPWSTDHLLAIAGLTPPSETSVELLIEDVNSNATQMMLSLEAVGSEGIVLTEILADPIGLEPDQEFVEIYNAGIETADLSGWMIDDNGDADGDILPEGTTLQPGQVAILVSPEFDNNVTTDPPPHPDGLVIVLASSLGSNGLKNSEAESIELYNQEGVVVSSYAGEMGKPKEGISVIRRVAELPEGAPNAFVLNPEGSSSPGAVPRLQPSW